MIDIDQSVFMEAFGVDALIEGELDAVRVIFDGDNVNSGERGFDYDMTASKLSVEIESKDKAKFIEGKAIQIVGNTFTIFRGPVQNMNSLEWEVELEP